MVVEVLVEEVAEEEIFRAAEEVSDPCVTLVCCAQKINANGGQVAVASNNLMVLQQQC